MTSSKGFFVPRARSAAVFGAQRLPSPLGGDCEGLAVFGDAVDGAQELAHGGDEGELGGLSGGAQALVETSQQVPVLKG